MICRAVGRYTACSLLETVRPTPCVLSSAERNIKTHPLGFVPRCPPHPPLSPSDGGVPYHVAISLDFFFSTLDVSSPLSLLYGSVPRRDDSRRACDVSL